MLRSLLIFWNALKTLWNETATEMKWTYVFLATWLLLISPIVQSIPEFSYTMFKELQLLIASGLGLVTGLVLYGVVRLRIKKEERLETLKTQRKIRSFLIVIYEELIKLRDNSVFSSSMVGHVLDQKGDPGISANLVLIPTPEDFHLFSEYWSEIPGEIVGGVFSLKRKVHKINHVITELNRSGGFKNREMETYRHNFNEVAQSADRLAKRVIRELNQRK